MAQALSRPLPRLRVARRPAAVGALFVLLALVFAPATATAEAPLRLPDHITDTAGVLDAGQRADVQNALDTLYDEHKVSLWVVYTADFDGLSREAWTEQTAKLSGLGNKDALLAVATTGRDYWLDVRPRCRRSPTPRSSRSPRARCNRLCANRIGPVPRSPRRAGWGTR